jgi:phospholipase C
MELRIFLFFLYLSPIVLTPCAFGQSPDASHSLDPGSPIQHVIIIVQENRSTDNLFHDTNLIAEGADIASYGLNSKGQTVKLKPVKLADGFDLDHGHSAFVTMYNKGKMDGADLLQVYCTKRCPVDAHFRYVVASDVTPYFQLAEKYTFADHMFQTNQGPSFPAHQFLLAGTSAPTATSPLFAASDIYGSYGHADWDMGCGGPAGEATTLIDPEGHESKSTFPCFDHPTLTDLLDNAGLTWLYYTSALKSIWTAPNAISHIRNGDDWAKVILPQTQILTDIANGELANVSWVTPSGQASDHPWMNRGLGPSWVASIVNAVGNSRYWSNSAIFIVWDDWGGWYDHVPPKIFDSYEYGFRVPMIVVSPYAKKAYISHVTHDFGSILKFIEKNWHLPSLGYADARADDLSDCFKFDQAKSDFETIPSPYDANYFLNDHTPPTPADTD